jgi:hypothetical protein
LVLSYTAAVLGLFWFMNKVADDLGSAPASLAPCSSNFCRKLGLVTHWRGMPARSTNGGYADAARMQLPKWRHTNRQFMATRRWGSHDRDLPCPAGRTRNCANLLPCGRQVRRRKLRNDCTACARGYAARQCGCARTGSCRALFPNISTLIRQSGRGRDQGSWQSHHRHPMTTASRSSRVQPWISITRVLAGRTFPKGEGAPVSERAPRETPALQETTA